MIEMMMYTTKYYVILFEHRKYLAVVLHSFQEFYVSLLYLFNIYSVSINTGIASNTLSNFGKWQVFVRNSHNKDVVKSGHRLERISRVEVRIIFTKFANLGRPARHSSDVKKRNVFRRKSAAADGDTAIMVGIRVPSTQWGRSIVPRAVGNTAGESI